jgi:M6 family metalloprotease-like protein
MNNQLHFLPAIFIFVILCLVNPGRSMAVTAIPTPVHYTQPDGSVITLLLRGDEHIHWAETTDGYTVLSNRAGFYEYAAMSPDGKMTFSGIRAHDPGSRKQQDENFLQTIRKGIFFNAEQVREMKSVLKGKSNTDAPLLGGFPTTGTRKLLMIMSNFSNTTTTYTQANFNNYMNQVNYNGTGSFRDYYLEVSYGQLTVNTTVTVWVTVPNPHDYYGPETEWGEFAYASVVAANNQAGVNFADYDNDGDGYVDGVAIIHQGRGQEESGNINDIWSHSWDLMSAGYSTAQLTFDGVVVLDYTTQPELYGTSSMGNIGVMCHEFGHNLGSPDFYDTDYSTSGSYNGTGYWDVMASGSWNGSGGTKPAHHNAWTKNFFGWTTPSLISLQQPVTLRNAQVYTDAVRYNTITPNEYFLCENRQQTGFDVGIPGHGLIIYHVDGNYISAHMGANDINCTSHQGMFPMAANSTTGNGVATTSSSTINTSGCPFPGTASKTTFTDATTPNSKSWAGVNTDKPVVSISENTGTKEISFCLIACSSPNDPSNFIASAAGSSQVNLSWTKNAANDPVMVACSSTPTFGTPANGTAYLAGASITGGGTVIYDGTNTSFIHPNLDPNTIYYYKAWSVMSGTAYSPGVVTSAQTPCGIFNTFPLAEDFNASTSMPDCWSQEAVGTGAIESWEVSESVNAGGTVNEMISTYQNINPGTCRLKTYGFNTVGVSALSLSFRHKLDDYGAGATLRVQSSSDGVNWTNEAWSAVTGGGNIGPVLVNTTITHNLNSPSTIVAFVITGNLYQYDYWYIDDVSVKAPGYWVGGTPGTPLDWNTAANWGDGVVPTAATNVYIPNRTSLPVVSNDPAAPAVCNNLVIDVNASVTVSPGKKLVVNGNVIKN